MTMNTGTAIEGEIVTLPATGVGAIRPALIGVATGLRSQAGMAALSLRSRTDAEAPGGPLAFIGRERAARIATAALASEIFLDKLPFVSSRLRLPALTIRLGLAAVAGKSLADRDGLPVGNAMAEAVAGALGGAIAGRTVRAFVTRGKRRGLRTAFTEDAVAAGLAAFASRSIQRQVQFQR
jgi:uncharacterized membrane protein